MFNMRRILTVGFILALGTALVATPADADKAQAQIQTNSINAVFTFESSKEGVRLTARAEGLASQEEYAYHIHEKPVPSSGSCSETGGHLDPFNRTSSAVCTPTTPEKCEMGDLSGKWGKLKTNNRGVVDPVRHIDPTLSLNGEHSIIGLSVVMHNSKGERIACGTIQAMNDTSSAGDDADSSDAMLTAAPSTAAMLSLLCAIGLSVFV